MNELILLLTWLHRYIKQTPDRRDWFVGQAFGACQLLIMIHPHLQDEIAEMWENWQKAIDIPDILWYNEYWKEDEDNVLDN